MMAHVAAEPTTHLRENPYEIAKEQLRRVGRAFAIDENLVNVLSECKKAVTVSIPTRMDDGSVDGLRGLPRHAQHRARARRRAGSATTRTSPSTRSRARDVDDVEVRADGDPVRRREGRRRRATRSALSRLELERMTRRYTSEIINEIGPERDIPAPDVGTNAAGDGLDLRHVLDEQGPLGARRRHRQAARDRRLARARGGDRARRRLLRSASALRKQGLREQGMRVAIQGFGNVGLHLSRVPRRGRRRGRGRVSDSTGGLLQPGRARHRRR